MGDNDENQDVDRVKTTVFRLINIRPRSEKEIREKLFTKEFDTETIDRVVYYFKTIKLINDEQFAKLWVRSRLLKPMGFYRIKLELKEKGVSDDIISAAIENAKTDDYNEADVVRNLARRRAKIYKDNDQQKIKQRVYNYLLRRGFKSDLALKAIKAL